MADEKKDPWEKSTISKTIKTRKAHRRDLLHVINAMDSQLEYELAKMLKKKGDVVPNYDYIIEGSDVYDKDLAKKVVNLIDKVYDVDSDLHPLKSVIDKANLDKNYFNKQLIDGLYFSHKEGIKQAVGKRHFVEIMKKTQGANVEKIGQETQKHAVGDIDPDKHGDSIYDFIKDEYKIDESKVDKDRLKHDATTIMYNHIFGQLGKDDLHEMYRKKKAA